ncbi:class F sortase [Halobacillus litoralis]|uniref:class F sortase n=1 Tax=Halobacillus litoralis TaxID=45668 RepID=UPI001CFD8725|nr:class F sortase [Halobacillus litoralis]
MYKLLPLFLLLFLFACSTIQESEAGVKSGQEADVGSKTDLRAALDNQSSSSVKSAGNTGKMENTAIVPASISIPAINVQADIEEVGRYENGQMGEPKSIDGVGWYQDGYLPGEKGSSVMAGHVDSKTGPAVFYHLEDLNPGDKINVTDAEGQKQTFIVQKSESYDRKEAPLNKIFGFSYRRQLNLITCTGEFNKQAGTHDKRLVVYTVHEDDVTE